MRTRIYVNGTPQWSENIPAAAGPDYHQLGGSRLEEVRSVRHPKSKTPESQREYRAKVKAQKEEAK